MSIQTKQLLYHHPVVHFLGDGVHPTPSFGIESALNGHPIASPSFGIESALNLNGHHPIASPTFGLEPTSKGLLNGPGQNNCFLNCAVQVRDFVCLFIYQFLGLF